MASLPSTLCNMHSKIIHSALTARAIQSVMCKQYSQQAHTMKKWQIYQYGGMEELVLTDTATVPAIQKPDQILVKVQAASINPIDTLMIGGYGSVALNRLRKVTTSASGSEFPLTVGRDFSGEVVDTGRSPLATKYKPGDKVWGALQGTMSGSHAEYIITSSNEISKRPHSISYIEAASIPYVACTVWTALCSVGDLSSTNTAGKRVLVHAGSGGIGTFAIQLLKAWGAEVTTTCATDAFKLVQSLGADVVIDYKLSDVKKELQKIKGFDLILDPLGGDTASYSMDLLRNFTNAKYINIASSLMKNMDSYGLGGGLATSAVDLGLNLVKGFSMGRSYRWAFFMPNGKALAEISTLVDEGLIKPVVEKVYSFAEVPGAFQKVSKKKGRGKSVIDIDGSYTRESQASDTSSG